MTATAIVIASSLALAVPIGWYLSDTHRGFYHLWKVMAPSADKSLSAPKQNLFSGRVTGSVLEIGAGIGVNVPRIAAELPAVTNVKLVEPNTYMHDDLLAATRSSGLTSVKITADSAVALPVRPDRTCDERRSACCDGVLARVEHAAPTVSRRLLLPRPRCHDVATWCSSFVRCQQHTHATG